MDKQGECRRSSLSSELVVRRDSFSELVRRESFSSEIVRRDSSLELVRRESWQSECSWGEEGSTCLGLAIDGPWSTSRNPPFDSQSEISTEVRGVSSQIFQFSLAQVRWGT